MAELRLEIITPSKAKFSGIIQSVTIPGTLGSFQVLVNHAPLISSIETGVIKVVLPNNDKLFYTISSGTVEVLNNKVLLLADSSEKIDEIDPVRAKEAQERALKRLANKTDKETNVDRAQHALKRAVNRLTAVEKYIKSEV